MSNRTYVIALLAITLCAWGLRLAVTEKFVGLASVPDPADGLDQLDYELFAWHMSRGEGYTLESGIPSARRSPGASLVILPVYWMFGRSYFAARVWMTFLSAITCCAAASVIRRPSGNGTALLAAMGVAVNPGLFYYAIHLWSEVPFCLAITLATGFTVRLWNGGHWRDRVFAGICWGFALLIRPQVVFLAPVLALAAVWNRGVIRRRLVFETAVQAALIVAVAAPWVVRNAIVMGKPSLAMVVGGYTFWGAHNIRTFHDPRFRGLWVTPSDIPDAPAISAENELQQEAITWKLGLDSVKQNTSAVPELLVWKLYRLITPFEETPNRRVYWAFAITWIITAPLAVIGMRQLWHRDRILTNVILLQLAGTVLCVLMFYGAARFRHAIEPLLMIAAAAGVIAVSRWIHQGSSMAGLLRVPQVSQLGISRAGVRSQTPHRDR